MKASNLREAASLLNAAADHVEQQQGRGAGAGSFNWKSLLAKLLTLIPEIVNLFGEPAPPQS
jgi:hypothetical protein